MNDRIKLLPQGDIQDRIAAVLDPHAGEKIANILWKDPSTVNGTDGSGRPALGVVLAVQLAVEDYVEQSFGGFPPALVAKMAYPVRLQMADIIRACVADADGPEIDATRRTVIDARAQG